VTHWLGVLLITAVFAGGIVAAEVARAPADVVANGKPAPEIAQGAWVNSEPLTMQKLRGRVVLVDFWTYG
jgi:hypothetical protein